MRSSRKSEEREDERVRSEKKQMEEKVEEQGKGAYKREKGDVGRVRRGWAT